ncbi:hypothetical protein HPB52_004701 [Rhipicephalus sanguineus]|uniref:Uncharacterized protein n=1 Tax=Rhipicephalus sanguineus TaxID=34632 RepID=A0A9D4SVM5_RHISA|nr:hypothetical protein HPB52_004701 [Rhipicephalus sanguineus]
MRVRRLYKGRERVHTDTFGRDGDGGAPPARFERVGGSSWVSATSHLKDGTAGHGLSSRSASDGLKAIPASLESYSKLFTKRNQCRRNARAAGLRPRQQENRVGDNFDLRALLLRSEFATINRL